MDREIVIKNKSGLHARPAAKFVVFAKNFTQPITVTKGEKSAPATSLIGILSLGITQGDRIRLTVEGENAQQVLDQFSEFIDQLAYEQ
ncbi:MAG: HPr family phosphocarrier protein [Desulfitobacteriaceae bacterium]|nr:HPr family phosphocarrier protein [Desulfitobacteriaceae bacterium]MDI6879564.1 HPr family phosphocarrier protein [Desulfitobacteriaceae bacterium]MDI6913354.1 HPr family phosphocarrier protein [Desulfitobacteriaceae bacterium]